MTVVSMSYLQTDELEAVDILVIASASYEAVLRGLTDIHVQRASLHPASCKIKHPYPNGTYAMQLASTKSTCLHDASEYSVLFKGHIINDVLTSWPLDKYLSIAPRSSPSSLSISAGHGTHSIDIFLLVERPIHWAQIPR